jgi:cytoskeletal protein CcmA (bactofilin family)
VPINNESKTGPSATATPNSSGPNVRTPAYLGPGLKINGQITGDEDLKIDGRVEGPISLGHHRLTVGQTAQVRGEIVAREIMIYGGRRIDQLSNLLEARLRHVVQEFVC